MVICMFVVQAGLIAGSVGIQRGASAITIVVFAVIDLAFLAALIWLTRLYWKLRVTAGRTAAALDQRGVETTAKIVDKEEQSDSDSTEFFIFYQFRPDFRVKVKDPTWHSNYYNLPVGSEIRIKYLPDDPTVSALTGPPPPKPEPR
jgi:hypothetical protein